MNRLLTQSNGAVLLLLVMHVVLLMRLHMLQIAQGDSTIV